MGQPVMAANLIRQRTVGASLADVPFGDSGVGKQRPYSYVS